MLLIKKQRRRKALFNIATGFLLDTAIAAAILYAIGTDDYFTHLFYIVAGINGLYLFVWLRMQAMPWITYLISGKKALTAAYLDLFTNNDFPKPRDTIHDCSDYLADVVDDPECSVDTRVFAGHVLGEMNTFLSMGIVSDYVKINIAVEKALEAYYKTFKDEDPPEFDGAAPALLEYDQETPPRMAG